MVLTLAYLSLYRFKSGMLRLFIIIFFSWVNTTFALQIAVMNQKTMFEKRNLLFEFCKFTRLPLSKFTWL